MLGFGALAVRDIAADTAVADEAPDLVEHWDARDGDIARAAVRGRAGKLEIPEREVGVERGPVLAPSLFVGLDVWDLPPRLAELRSRCVRVGQPFGEFLTREAMLGVALPVHVEGELHQRAEALLARTERPPGAPAPGTELAEQQTE